MTYPSAPRPNIVSASSRPPLRLRGWPAWGWLVLPWLLASVILRPHSRILVTALVCTAPAIWFWWEVSQMR